MSQGFYSQGKRAREQEKARKKREKADRRAQKRIEGPRELEISTAEEEQRGLPSTEEALSAMEARAAAPRRATVPCRLFVGSLSWETTTDDLRAEFEKFGPVDDAVVLTDRDTGRSRGFGFVNMADRKDAARAVKELDGAEIQGRNIVVNVATER